MDRLRRRLAFKVEDDKDDDDNIIYDEQQQGFVIRELQQETDAFSRKALFSLRVLVGLSFIIQLFNNPFLARFSLEESMLSIPLRIIFIIPSFLIHYHLAVILSSQFRDYFYRGAMPVSYRFLYLGSVLAPTISLCSQIPWKVAIWWSYTPLVVFAVHRVTNSIEGIKREIAILETMKYRAPGA